jgi:hypothetical protein
LKPLGFKPTQKKNPAPPSLLVGFNFSRSKAGVPGVVGFKTKPPPLAKAPPIDAFPTYDEQPEPSADDYIRNLDYPAEIYF